MPKYPAQIDNSQSLPTAIDNLTPVQGSIFNKLRDAVLAVESELGIKPSGSYTTVRSRLDNLEGIVGNLQIIELHKDLGGIIGEPVVIGIQGRPISTIAPKFGDILTWNGIAWIPASGGAVLPDGYSVEITVTPPVLGANAIGSIVVDMTGTIFSEIIVGSGVIVNAPPEGVSGGGFVANAYVSTTGNITYIFHGPTTGASQNFTTTQIS